MRTTQPGHTTGTPAVLSRLRRIEGQIRGLQRLVEEERNCADTLTQIAAATKALESVALMLLDQHLQQCLGAADNEENRHQLDEASAAIRLLVRT